MTHSRQTVDWHMTRFFKDIGVNNTPILKYHNAPMSDLGHMSVALALALALSAAVRPLLVDTPMYFLHLAEE